MSTTTVSSIYAKSRCELSFSCRHVIGRVPGATGVRFSALRSTYKPVLRLASLGISVPNRMAWIAKCVYATSPPPPLLPMDPDYRDRSAVHPSKDQDFEISLQECYILSSPKIQNADNVHKATLFKMIILITTRC